MFFKILGRVFGSFFNGIGKALMALPRWLARHEALLGILTVVTIGIFGIWLLLTLLNVNVVFGSPQTVSVAAPTAQVVPPTATATAAPSPVSQTAVKGNAPLSTETFMTGQVNGDANLVWDALNSVLHNRYAGEGRDKTYFQRVFESLKKTGTVYENYQYIGGVPSENGTSIHFYVLTVRNGSNKQISQVPFTFVLDKEGKIADLLNTSS